MLFDQAISEDPATRSDEYIQDATYLLAQDFLKDNQDICMRGG